MLQAVLRQVVDATLKEIRKQYFADLDSFWDARNIYQAQLQALQVLHGRACLHDLLSSAYVVTLVALPICASPLHQQAHCAMQKV